MLTIKNLKHFDGSCNDLSLISEKTENIEAKSSWRSLPALIDPHVHFRTPGDEHKENWKSGAMAAIRGGVSTVFDMPNTHPSCVTIERLLEKKKLIEKQLDEIDIPLRYHLYFGASEDHLDEVSRLSGEAIGIKIFMGSSTGDLLITDEKVLDSLFCMASKLDLMIAVHAECEETLEREKLQLPFEATATFHSKVRPREAAIRAVKKALALSMKWNTKLMILHVTTKEELALIREAKQKKVPVFAEATPHHLFLAEKDYDRWGCFVQMNPPLRTEEDRQQLWEAIGDGTIDPIGTDHAPHLLHEKNLPYGQAPSGVPGIETMLPLLLDAHLKGTLSLQKIVDLTSKNVARIYQLPPIDDIVIVDLDKKEAVDNKRLQTKCGWSPFAGKVLKGHPIFTVIQGKCYDLRT